VSAAVSWTDLRRDAVARAPLEWLLTDPQAFALTTATPLQRAICRIADGRPLGPLAKDDAVQAGLGATVLKLDKPREFALLCAIRGGKSLIAGAAAIRMSQTCDVSLLGPGEVPRVSVVSTRMDLAQVVLGHVVGRMQASPILSSIQLADPTADSVLVRHPTGRPIEIKVVAGARAGTTLVARWSAGVIFDEFPRMVGGDEGVVNWDDSRAAVVLRLLPNAQIWDIGSPWAPYGPAYEMVQQHFGKPTEQLVVVRGDGPSMNPVFWTPAQVEIAKKNPDAYRTDCLAEFATPEQALLSAEVVETCTRKTPIALPPEAGCVYSAAIDPATRGNGWTLVIGTRKRAKKKVIVRAEEWRGSRSAPLNPAAVLKEIAAILGPYRVNAIKSDQHMGDALRELARQQEVEFPDGSKHPLLLLQVTTSTDERAEAWLAIRTRLELTEIELPPAPLLRSDLLHLKKRSTTAGMLIDLPLTSDGRHCDFAPPLMLVLAAYIAEERKQDTEARGQDPQSIAMREAVRRRFQKKPEVW
jgi:hypothetical protein